MAKVAQEPSTFHAVSVAVQGKEVPIGKSAQVLRQSFRRHVACLSNEEREEAILFRSLAAPRLLPSIGATLISSSFATLILAAHGVNERSREQTGSLLSCFFRGLIAGVWMTLVIAPVFLIFAPTGTAGSSARAAGRESGGCGCGRFASLPAKLPSGPESAHATGPSVPTISLRRQRHAGAIGV